ncbi:GDP-mannose 4,6-dehydratase [Candidatus Woesearchaeota archaeon]|nr:GDP-mannose 4,6-dehydratase [Candidatus Woesearchaeota archaeon]
MFKRILITGGAGFVGSNLAVFLKKDFPKSEIICLDNLKRRGSELTISRLKKENIKFVHGDIRNKEDLENLGKIDCIIECSAEPSVLSGYGESPEYLINTNLLGTINCLELARKNNSKFLFLSTSRVYPSKTINKLKLLETETRLELEKNQSIKGISEKGISEQFPMEGSRSLYGATKLASEIIINEYVDAYKLQAVINRCGLLTGPWQMGKIDQGVIVLWIAKHLFKGKLNYIGYGGKGKQVRDILHIRDLYRLLKIQLSDMKKFNGKTYNVGGGRKRSISLLELTRLCQKHSRNKVTVGKIKENRKHDIPIYLTDNSKIEKESGWKPVISPEQIVIEITNWIKNNKKELEPILK